MKRYLLVFTILSSAPTLAGSLCNPQNFQILAKLAAANGIEWNGSAADCWIERSTNSELYTANREVAEAQQVKAIVTPQPARVQFMRGDKPIVCLDIASTPKALGSDCSK